jgi:hypothetical protein
MHKLQRPEMPTVKSLSFIQVVCGNQTTCHKTNRSLKKKQQYTGTKILAE